MSVQAIEAFSPYSNVTARYSGGLPTWMNAFDAQRINAYQVYEQIYWSVQDTFKLAMRGDANTDPIYVPTARTLVDTTSRFLCTQPGFVIDKGAGSDSDQELARQMYSKFFRRERFWSKFHANKQYGIIRGDWVWHVLGNPAKIAGTRLKIEPIDPAAYFPVTHPDDPDRIIAAHIVEQVADEEGTIFIRRQTYYKGADPLNNDGSDTTIWNSIGLFATDKWEALDDSAVTVVKPPTPLPPDITAIPLYHIRNIETPGDPYGSSELRGFERIMAAVNQAVSDEEMALALEGLGLYETDGGPPRDESGNITNWVLGPGNVVEHARGSTFKRVTGVNSVTPVMDHLNFLIKSLKEASATPDVATGLVDVTVAESGIARMMAMGPMLSKIEVREDSVSDVLMQMFWDLRTWFKAYEQFDTVCIAEPVFGDAVPIDKDGEIDRIMTIFNAGLADDNWARAELQALGYVFDTNMADKVLSMQAARAAATDPFAARMETELDEEAAGGTDSVN
jgi:hypothetical protein